MKIMAVARPERGGSPAYTPWHVIEALRLLSQTPIGRPTLVGALKLGESSVKTLVRRLVETGLITRTPRGHVVTDDGKTVLDVVTKALTIGKCRANAEGLGLCSYVIIPYPPPMELTTVYSIRDFAVARGCRTVVVGYVEGGKVGFPGLPRDVEYGLLRSLGLRPSAELRGTVLIALGGCEPRLMSAALDLLAECCALTPQFTGTGQ